MVKQEMKIKILKDIPGYPGYKIGEIIEVPQKGPEVNFFESVIMRLAVYEGNAAVVPEEVKDEIDMKEIREKYDLPITFGEWLENKVPGCIPFDDLRFFINYRIVKAVIEKLNGTYKVDWRSFHTNKWGIKFNHTTCTLSPWAEERIQYSPIPHCVSLEITEKVIELCEPELKILFGVK